MPDPLANIGKTPRIIALESMGPVCMNCANEDIRVLGVVNTVQGEGAALRKTMSRDKYFIGIIRDFLNNPTNHKYRVLCANCRKIWMLERSKPGKASMSPMIAVWKPSVGVDLQRQQYPWLDKYVQQGFEVVLLLGDGVYRYMGEKIFDNWPAFAGARGLAVAIPVDSVTVFKQDNEAIAA